MKFWVIAYKLQTDVYVDLDRYEDTFDLKSTCFLPTKNIAEQFIKAELSDNYIPVEIELETLNKNGVWSWSREEVDGWDDDWDE